MPDVEEGTSIILIRRETFCLLGTRIELLHPRCRRGSGLGSLAQGWSAPGMAGCRSTDWRVKNLVSLGAQNGRRETYSHLSAP
jgi:hypothetical protein